MMRRPMWVPVVAMAFGVAGCGPPAGEPADTMPADSGPVQGVVRVVGSEPVDVHVVVRRESGGDVRVVGPLRDEIRRLSGAVVRVSGDLEPPDVPVAERQIRASEYEIVSVNGEPVVHGVVESRSGGWTILRTRSGERVYLASAPESFQVGQTVWVQGPRAAIVQAFGVVRD
jgi:hypothetical protein